jgi:hypothetical protein
MGLPCLDPTQVPDRTNLIEDHPLLLDAECRGRHALHRYSGDAATQFLVGRMKGVRAGIETTPLLVHSAHLLRPSGTDHVHTVASTGCDVTLARGETRARDGLRSAPEGRRTSGA